MLVRIVWLAILSAVAAGSTCAQGEPASGLYQIVSGLYTECCGIAGEFAFPLPRQGQCYVELTVDAGQNVATMRFLADDKQTVFHSITGRQGFTFSFTNGLVLSNYIWFDPLFGTQIPGRYTVINSPDGLWINGEVNVRCEGCADIPTKFEHTGVVAVRVAEPLPVIDRIERGDGSLRFHFAGEPPNDYTVEYTDSLREPVWHPLAVYRAKLTTIDATVTSSFTNASMRFFRLRKEPCNCD